MAAKSTKTSKTAAPAVELPTTAPHIETLLNTTRSVAERQAKAGWNLTSSNVDKVTTHMMSNMNSASSMNNEMYEATTQYCQTWAKGGEEITKSYVNFCQSMMQDCMSTFKSMTSAKSPQDAMTMQSDFVRQQFDKAMSESTRLSEMCVKVASDAAEPIQSQWTTAVSKYSRAA